MSGDIKGAEKLLGAFTGLGVVNELYDKDQLDDVLKAMDEWAGIRSRGLLEALEECDTTFSRLEDFCHGREGEIITMQRFRIQQAISNHKTK